MLRGKPLTRFQRARIVADDVRRHRQLGGVDLAQGLFIGVGSSSKTSNAAPAMIPFVKSLGQIRLIEHLTTGSVDDVRGLLHHLESALTRSSCAFSVRTT